MEHGFSSGYALVVGIASYPYLPKLPTVVLKDAQDVAGLLCAPQYCGYRDANVKILLDKDATKDAIASSLDWLAESAGPQDTVVVFFSCHGGRIEAGPLAGNYLLPYDCQGENLSPSFSHDELTHALSQIKSERLALMFDFCYAAGSAEAKAGTAGVFALKNGFLESEYKKLASGSGRVLMASSRADETSLVLAGMQNSLFTYYLLEALKGSSRNAGDGIIRVFDVFDYVSTQIPRRAATQHPVFKAEVENNFPLALFRGGQKSPGFSSPGKVEISSSVLRKAIVDSFSLPDFDLLCSDVQEFLAADGITEKLSADIIGGNGLDERAHRLIRHLERRGYTSYLVKAIQNNRPGLI